MARLSVELNRYFFEEERSEGVILADIILLAGERIFGFLFVFLALPSALPVPAPFYSVPFGFVLLLLAVQLIAGAQRPWMPRRVMNHPIALSKVQGILKAGIPWLEKIELFSRPRLTYICKSLPGRVVIGSAIALMAVSMMIPIPGTNTLPAIGVFVTGFGLLDDDGVISLSGLVLCVMGFVFSAVILIGIWFGGFSLLDLIRNWLAQ